ncbi:MAG: phospho-sugar mutase, partial [Planctomycetota bacterium]|nr:phospho-sugar mutase [Planctomycetota bacterium]
NHVSNPENKAVFDSLIQRGTEVSADLIMATDPDCDRLGAAAPLEADGHSDWATFNGNQIGVLLADFVLSQRQQAGTLSADHYVITTLVTTGMIAELCKHYGVRCENNNLVGFKWIGDLMDRLGPDHFVFGTEESHGYLVGQHARDKDGAVACLLMAELAALVKSQNQSLHEHLDSLYEKHGLHGESLLTIQMEGSDGMKRMELLMNELRTNPPEEIGGIRVAGIRDYLLGTQKVFGESKKELGGPTDNLIFLDLKEKGNYIAVRPSGTEPKVKFYMFTKFNPGGIGKLGGLKRLAEDRIKTFERDLHEFEKCL